MLANADVEGRLLYLIRHSSGQEALQVRNQVGLLQTPSGTQIEILPKDTEGFADVAASRKRFWKMLGVVIDLPIIEANPAHLDVRNMPLLEILIRRFLQATADLVRRGIRNQYKQVVSEEAFLKGKLLLAQQLRQRPGRQKLLSY